MKYNYKRLSCGKDENGKRIFIDEHRKIMEEHIGRKLNRYEVVHHINGNKKDNRIENLQLMTLSEHSRLHQKGIKRSEETKRKLSKIFTHRIGTNRSKTKEDIINIVLKYKKLKNYRKVDRFFNLSNGTTGNIIRGNLYYDYQPIIKKILNNKV